MEIKNEEPRQSTPQKVQHEKVLSTEYIYSDENGNLYGGVRIHPEFEKLIHPLSKEEFMELEKNILQKGCLDSIKVWQGYVVDGHHRYKICEKNNLPFEVLDVDFDDEWAVKLWMVNNQLGRRNLTDAARIEYASLRVDITRGVAQRNQEESRFGKKEEDYLGALPDKTKRTIERRVKKQQTIVRNVIGAVAGVSGRTVSKYLYLQKHADKEDLATLREGKLVPFGTKGKKKKLSIDSLYREVKTKDKAQIKKFFTVRENLPSPQKLFEKVDNSVEESQVEALAREDIFKEDVSTRIITHPIGDLSKYVESNSVDVIITEPPCKEEDIDLFDQLGDFARHALKDGAPCVVIAGNQFLPDFIEMMRAHLDYCWTLSFNAARGVYESMSTNIETAWKPILVFTKGEPNLKPFSDCANSLESIVESFSYIGETICDPFCNNGSIGKVCLKKKRSFVGSDISIEKTQVLKDILQPEKA